ncbi:hypothetical protein DYB36_013685 [Aphanomyces astaci]|uniref:Uncharacterized protein n=1 Tax=Aphanomyces astaci TaxID=112090 RepID=A0A397AD34_APHAT|nr:hypothetical protein DYB36_013685 [Aphanomyces astaci]
MEPEPATPRAVAPPTTYDPQQGSLSDRTLDDGFYTASTAAANPQPEAATEPMASLPREQALPRIPETSGQQQGYPPGAAYGGLPAQSYRPLARQSSRVGSGSSMVMSIVAPNYHGVPTTTTRQPGQVPAYHGRQSLMGIIHGGQRVAPSQHTSFHHHVYAAPVQAQGQGWVDDVRAREHALQQHEMQLAAHRERIEADRRQAHFEWEQRQMHQAAAQYKYAVEQDATAHTAQFKANLEREASGYKAHLDMEQQRAFNNANLNWQQMQQQHQQQQQLWQQQQQEARTTMDERLAVMRQEERARYNAQLRAAGVDVSAEGDAGVNIPTEGTAENTQLPGSPITSGVGEAPPGSFEDGSTFYTMGSRPMSAPVRHPTPTSPLPQSAAPLISGYTPTKPPVYGKDGFRERDQQKFAKRFIVYARGQDTISVSSGVRIGTVSMSSCMTAEALAHHARFQFDRPIEDIRETELSLSRLKQLSMDNTLVRTSDRMTDWQARYMDILTDEAAEDIDFFHPKAVIQALMYGIKPDGAKALVRNSYDFDDKEIKFNISKFWSHVRGVLSNVLPAMGAEADALPPTALATRNVPQQSQLRQQCWPPRSNDSKTTKH